MLNNSDIWVFSYIAEKLEVLPWRENKKKKDKTRKQRTKQEKEGQNTSMNQTWQIYSSMT